jgi:hypothetical protein
MLGLIITASSAVVGVGVVVWHKLIVPFDRMNELSRELDDPGYRIPAVQETPEVLPQEVPEDSYARFAQDLQVIYEANRQIPAASTAGKSPVVARTRHI